jgi:hypothetical protein
MRHCAFSIFAMLVQIRKFGLRKYSQIFFYLDNASETIPFWTTYNIQKACSEYNRVFYNMAIEVRVTSVTTPLQRDTSRQGKFFRNY